jgi:hypothetical protein
MVQKYWRQTLLVIALALLVVAPLYAAVTSANYDNCAAHQGQYPTKDNNYNKPSSPLVPAPNGVRIFWRCIGGYANENGNAITAASTFLLLIVTGLLGWVAYRQYTTTRAQLRAYIFPEGANVYCPGTFNPPDPINKDNPYVMWAIKNSGQTPAYEVVHWGEIDAREVARESLLVTPPLTRKSVMSLPPGGHSEKRSYLGRTLSAAEISDLNLGRAIYLHGILRYDDAFGQEHTTRYRLKYQGPWPPPVSGGSFLFCDEGNTAN